MLVCRFVAHTPRSQSRADHARRNEERTMTHDLSAPPEELQRTPPRRMPRSGWVTFAAVMFFLAAGANALYGIAALANDDYFRADELLFGDLAMWGWIYLGLALMQLLVAIGILRRSPVAIGIGAILATVHAFVALASIAAYPLWTTIVLAVDAMIIYALVVHADEEAW
jgi:hypothetical protein